MMRSWTPRWLERSATGDPEAMLVRLDVGARAQAPVTGLGLRLSIEVTLPAAWIGASGDELDAATRELDLRLLPTVEGALGGAVVRRVLGAESFRYDAYLPEERATEVLRLRERLGSLAPFALCRHEQHADPTWSAYLDWVRAMPGVASLRPSAPDPLVRVDEPRGPAERLSERELVAELADHQAINREIVAALLEQGDDPRIEREVVHFARLPSQAAAQLAAESLVTQGFAVEPPTEAEGNAAEWQLEASRVERLDGNQADRASELLLSVLMRHGGVYDGWDCAVAAGPRAEPARRSGARVRDPRRHAPPPPPSEVRRKGPA